MITRFRPSVEFGVASGNEGVSGTDTKTGSAAACLPLFAGTSDESGASLTVADLIESDIGGGCNAAGFRFSVGTTVDFGAGTAGACFLSSATVFFVIPVILVLAGMVSRYMPIVVAIRAASLLPFGG
jgi:hypothetical protein